PSVAERCTTTTPAAAPTAPTTTGNPASRAPTASSPTSPPSSGATKTRWSTVGGFPRTGSEERDGSGDVVRNGGERAFTGCRGALPSSEGRLGESPLRFSGIESDP